MKPNTGADAPPLPVPIGDGVDLCRELAGFQDPHCYICEAELLPPYEMDHFPIPKCCGGAHTMRVCRACHDLKDRAAWITVATTLVDGIREISFYKEDSRNLNFLLHGELSAVARWVHDCWSDFGRAGRIFAARLLRVRYMREHKKAQPEREG